MLWFALFLSLPQTAPDTIQINTMAAVGRTGLGGRRSIQTDEVQHILNSTPAASFRAGDSLTLTDGSKVTWTEITANPQGQFRHSHLSGGWAFAEVSSDREKVMILEAAGHSAVYVNGEPRGGDPYSYGWLKLPVKLKKGANRLLFLGGRGSLSAKLVSPAKPVFLTAADSTLPDFVVGERQSSWAAVVIVNATERWLTGLTMEATLGGAVSRTVVSSVPPLSSRKVGFQIGPPSELSVGNTDVSLALRQNALTLDEEKVTVRIRSTNSPQKRTFLSQIDGSVQYYAVHPCSDPTNREAALVLTCHGASVEAIGQVEAYSSKSWAHIVAPTNRRPFGFDWEDWGRMDALEVLTLAKDRLPHDPSRVFLTGHSMGGHGTYQLGALYPGEFAAIGPSAAWVSFDSYTGSRFAQNPTEIERMMERAMAPSRTEQLVKNYEGLGVYILHGDADDNVPVREARGMRSLLEAFHKNFRYFEQPGAGHWWESSDEPGAECVDWPAMFDFFAQQRRPRDFEVRRVQFSTMSPAISSRRAWAVIHSQIRQLEISTIDIQADPHQRRFEGVTHNVQRLHLHADPLISRGPTRIILDKQELGPVELSAKGPLHIERVGGRWSLAGSPNTREKHPGRSGLLKEAFKNRFLLVYGTNGSNEENQWSFAKARYDAETFYYRGNGSVDIVSDKEYLAMARSANRNAIFFGNADTNVAWRAKASPDLISVLRGAVSFAGQAPKTGSYTCLFVRPEISSASVMYAFIGGTDIKAMRATDRLPYFVSGTAYPDLVVLDSDFWRLGSKAIQRVGFFGNDWAIDSGDWASN